MKKWNSIGVERFPSRSAKVNQRHMDWYALNMSWGVPASPDTPLCWALIGNGRIWKQYLFANRADAEQHAEFTNTKDESSWVQQHKPFSPIAIYVSPHPESIE